MARVIFKIVDEPGWRAAEVAGRFDGSAADRRDGYIHFSTEAQVRDTATRHFSGQRNLLLVAVNADALGDALRWERSRGGDLFPHLYSSLELHAVLVVVPLTIDEEGSHVFPALNQPPYTL